MKIFNIQRTKRFKGHNFEINLTLESHGRFMGPPTSTKNLRELMKLRGDIGHHIWQDKDDQQSRVDLSSKGYFLGHTISMYGPVRGGKTRWNVYSSLRMMVGESVKLCWNRRGQSGHTKVDRRQ